MVRCLSIETTVPLVINISSIFRPLTIELQVMCQESIFEDIYTLIIDIFCYLLFIITVNKKELLLTYTQDL